MQCYLSFFFLTNLLCSVAFAGKHGKKCDENDLFPEPPCCGTQGLQSEYRILRPPGFNILKEDVPFWVGAGGCNGVMLNSRWALTVDHCLGREWQTKPSGVRVLDHKIEADLNIKHYNAHIALIRLKQPLNLPEKVQPLCLPFSPEFRIQPHLGKNVTVFGYTPEKGFVNGVPTKRAKAIVPLIKCPYKDQTLRLCTKFIAQPGDSGTPLLMEADYNPLKIKAQYVVGVLIGSAGNKHTTTTLYPRLDTLTDWIKDTILANKD